MNSINPQDSKAKKNVNFSNVKGTNYLIFYLDFFFLLKIFKNIF